MGGPAVGGYERSRSGDPALPGTQAVRLFDLDAGRTLQLSRQFSVIAQHEGRSERSAQRADQCGVGGEIETALRVLG